jgi:hypothetical protein
MRSRLAFAVATATLLGHVGLFYRAVVRHTGGTYCYPIDDAFIHMAIAKHLAYDGVYGATKHAFSAASSSIAWPLLLALVDKVAGDHVVTPLVLNAIIGVALVAVCARLLRAEAPRARVAAQAIVLLAVVTLTPVPTLVASGMEHTLHALAMILFVAEAGRVLAADEKLPLAKLGVYGAFMVSARYEGLFPIAMVVLLALARRRPKIAVVAAASGAAPVLAFGLYSIAHGWMLLPNSVVLKARHLAFKSATDVGDFFGGDLFDRLTVNPHLSSILVITGATGIAFALRDGKWSPVVVRSSIVGFATVAHVQMASLGWFFRYEAYLVAVNVFFAGLALVSVFPTGGLLLDAFRRRRMLVVAGVGCAAVLAGPLVRRAVLAAEQTPLACRNIYEQQVQSARFLARYFPNDVAAINDIGAVAYYGDERIVDLNGLASMPVARAKKMNIDEPIPKREFVTLTGGAVVSIIYEHWLGDRVPPTWIRLARWKIESNYSCAFPEVSVFATSADAIPRVIEALRAFGKELPQGVHQEGRYLEPPPAEDADAPYRLRPGDVLAVMVDGALDGLTVVTIEDDGTFALPKVGPVLARGLTIDEMVAQSRHGSAMRARVLERASRHVWAAGRVLRPGDFVGSGPLTAPAMMDLVVAEPPGDAAYVLREDAGGFRRIPLDANGPPLVTRDILIVP